MKPLTLTLQAFGSYGKKQTIDFTKPEQNIFLITGDTGAGKTTIFDAIVYALYGEASSSSNKKAGLELQGQFVDYDVEPFVELVFSEMIGGREEKFTVRREPAHLRKKQRGTGVTPVAGSVSLLFEDGHEHPPKETNAKLMEIVGLTKDQFMQIAMIAQGEFMELLRADSKTKTEIFRKLFHTEIYRDIIAELDNRKKDMQKEMAIIRTECLQELGHVIVPDYYVDAAVLSAQIKQLTSNPNFTMKDLEALLSMIQKMCDSLRIDKESRERNFKTKSLARDEKRDAFHHANSLLQQFQALEAGQQTLLACDAKKEKMEQNIVLVKQIRNAYELAGIFSHLASLNKNVSDIKLEITKLEEQLPLLKTQLENTLVKEQEAQKLYDAQNKEYAATEVRVNKALESFSKIDIANKEKEEALKKLEQAKLKQEQVKSKMDAFAREENSWTEQMKQYDGIGQKLARCDAKVNEGKLLKTELNDIILIYNTMNGMKGQLSQAQSKYLAAKEAYEKKQKEYIHKQNLFYDAQAGILAREKLVAGKACPVCGAMEHPNPCTLSEEHSEITREALSRIQKQVDQLNQDYVNQSNESNKLATQCKEKQEQFDEGVVKLKNKLTSLLSDEEFSFGIVLTDDSINGMIETMKQWLEQIHIMQASLYDKQSTMMTLKAKLEGAATTREKLSAAFESARTQVTNADTNVKTTEQSLVVLYENVTYESKEAAGKELDEARQKREQASAIYQPAKRAAEQAKRAFNESNAVYINNKSILPAKENEASMKKSEYEEMLKKYALSQDSWQQLVSDYTKEFGNQLETEYNSYVNQRTAAETKIAQAKELIGNQQKPDVEALTIAKNEAEQALIEADMLLKEATEAFRANVAVINEIAPKMDARNAQTEVYSRLDNLYRRLSGNVSGSRMDIETYVQRYHLERVLYAANRRFHEMTSGQYELRMYELEKAGEGKNKGLDLMVYSTVTGKEREVRTLSGGESFLAALALALGMADQVQEKSSAINLDVMFIDEGFGSLDDNSRNQAIKVLQQMAGGSKMIGIISHVTELKQAIEDRLIITKDDNGSHARWER